MLAAARAREEKFEWRDAIVQYEEAIKQERASNPSEKARIRELIARAWFKNSFQATNREQFEQRMQLASDSYEKARSLYEEANSEPFLMRAKERSLFCEFWLAEDPPQRRNIIEKCISLAEDSLAIFQSEANVKNLAETRKDLLVYLFESQFFVKDNFQFEAVMNRVVRTGKKLIEDYENLREDEGLLESLHLIIMAQGSSEPERANALAQEFAPLLKQMSEVAARMGTPYAICLWKEAKGWMTIILEGDFTQALSLFESGATESRVLKDSFLTGRLLVGAIYAALWSGLNEDDLEIIRNIFQKGRESALEAAKCLEISSQGGLRNYLLDYVYGYHAEFYTNQMRLAETAEEKKGALLKLAIDLARKGEVYGENTTSGTQSAHALSKALYFLASLQENPDLKARFLKEALPIRERTVQKTELVWPRSWECGVFYNYLALIRAELSTLQLESDSKRQSLRDAVADMEHCVEICRKWLWQPGLSVAVANYEEWYGDILLKLHRLSEEPTVARRAIEIYSEAVSHNNPAGLTATQATILWKIAKIHDDLAEYEKSSEAFGKASQNYKTAATKIPASASLFSELASYMDAWSSIELARLHHSNEKYVEAAKEYDKSASILEQTNRWWNLSTHYYACSMLEWGEAASRLDGPQKAEEHFRSAVGFFDEARLEAERRLRKTVEPLEKIELEDWVAITLNRERYSGGRMKLEKAKLLDRNGEKEPSSVEYYAASEVFKALAKTAQTEQSRRELETLRLFSEAWSKMKEAEAKFSSELYEDAAELFLKIEKTAPKEKTRLLALANLALCKALASGTLFRRTRETGLYSEIKKNLETAADYYQEGDFVNAAEWTRATGRLFDALVYMADAESEKEPKKKTELFHLAEKHLELAATLYGHAGFSKKREEALKHLEKAREEKELLLTPLDALSENPRIASQVTPVSLSRDQSVGLERFESANLAGSLNVAEKDVGVGSMILMELDIANVGKGSAMLLKLENLAPEGLELDRERIVEKLRDGNIDLRGKRLDYLKTHEVKLALKATRKGSFKLQPSILFADDKGTQQTYQFEPTTINARELGISGWIKGPK